VRLEFQNRNNVYFGTEKQPEFCCIRHRPDGSHHYIRKDERQWILSNIKGLTINEIMQKYGMTKKVAGALKTESSQHKKRKLTESSEHKKRKLSPVRYISSKQLNDLKKEKQRLQQQQIQQERGDNKQEEQAEKEQEEQEEDRKDEQ
jgi:hypothetical protein